MIHFYVFTNSDKEKAASFAVSSRIVSWSILPTCGSTLILNSVYAHDW